jgi:uncharacterized protein YjbJ (UPF0337 family)
MTDEKVDEAKGRAKEAAGALTDDDELKREGKIDQGSSSIKEKLGDAIDKAEDVVDDVADKAKDKLGRDDDRS